MQSYESVWISCSSPTTYVDSYTALPEEIEDSVLLATSIAQGASARVSINYSDGTSSDSTATAKFDFSAVDASKAGKYTVKVTCQGKETSYEVEVKEFIIEDNGIGMSKTFMNDIFLPFAREKDKVKDIQGTGLGMPIAKNIIDLLGGTINVESEENKGTKFTIRFDFGIVNDSVKVVSQDTSMDNDLDLGGKRVLVVEDN